MKFVKVLTHHVRCRTLFAAAEGVLSGQAAAASQPHQAVPIGAAPAAVGFSLAGFLVT